MSDKKQSRLDNLEKRMAAVTNVIQQLINEICLPKRFSNRYVRNNKKYEWL